MFHNNAFNDFSGTDKEDSEEDIEILVVTPKKQSVFKALSEKLYVECCNKSRKLQTQVKHNHLLIDKLSNFEESDGNMSDISLVKVTNIESNTASIMLVKEIQIKKELIKNKLTMNIMQSKLSEKDLLDKIADEIVSSQVQVILNEQKVAEAIYPGHFVIFDNNKMLMPLLPGKKLFDPENIKFIQKNEFNRYIEVEFENI
ncbi:hypothetical protein N9L02_00940 [Gammaproteobacteria bacterium]|nr:hypothetical protein [Gammaproteobacteria bacterium]